MQYVQVERDLKLVIVLSGKRKSGKDHVSKLLIDHIGDHNSKLVALLRIAGPIKEQFSRDNELNFSKLLDSSEYKEQYRRQMVDWSEKRRRERGWNCFLEQAIREQTSTQNLIWILNDARRLCDIEYFEKQELIQRGIVELVKIRIEASDEIRCVRGWKFTEGIDDEETECGLDAYNNWTYVLSNNCNNDESAIKELLSPVFNLIDSALSIAKE